MFADGQKSRNSGQQRLFNSNPPRAHFPESSSNSAHMCPRQLSRQPSQTEAKPVSTDADWMRLLALPVVGFMLLAILQLSNAQGFAPSPAPAGPSNDGTAIDQVVAYVLLFVALAITYLVH
ncbi:hypothetical protein RJ639_001471 [Escallonia herrerae]|uniref:Uncharacterized protein n=1 Tax=Escallonia herrerae TaxID=1293975 RepID=A0AA88X7W6_9ASTE|nr:hypothetical protein RJ639_001471 [Escallonia herrerae]